MRDGHRAAALDLLLKQRDDAAVAAQHVSEAHRNAGHRRGPGEGLDQHLAQALGAAHDVRRVDSLVCRELDEPLHAVLGGGGQQVLGAKDVVLDGLGGADLHQRHMLVRRRVKDDGRMIGVEHIVQTCFIADGADEGDNRSFGTVLVFQFGFQLIGAVLVDVKNQQTAGLVAHDLTAKLAANGAAAARDENDLVMQVLGNLGIVQLDLVAGEEVCRVQLTEARCHRIAVLVNSLRVTDHPHAAVGGVAEVDDLAQTVTLDRRDGDDDLENMIFAHQLRYVGDCAAHRYALHTQALFGQVVVNDADRVAEALIFRLAEVDGPRTGVAGADNEQWRVILRLVGLGVAHRQDQPPQEPHARYGRRVEYRAEDQHRAGDRAAVVDQIEQHDDARRQPGKAGQACKVAHTGVLPHDLIQSAEPEHDHINGQDV